MKVLARAVSLSIVLAAATGCGRESGDAVSGDVATGPVADAGDTGPGPRDDAAAPGASPEPAAWDPAQLPVSTVPLGQFPYITVPDGYSTDSRVDRGKAFARFPFWVDGREHWVEGRFHEFNFDAEDDGSFSRLEVQRNLDAIVREMGGSKVSEAKIPEATVKGWGEEIIAGFGGLGDVYNNAAATYVVRRDDGNIWIHFVADTAQAWIVVGQEEGFEATAALMPPSEISDSLERDGRVALEVNFATDSATILDASMHQIDAVVTLLETRPELRLSINGHTDSSGGAERNMTLSRARAEAVVEAVVSQGVDRTRLVAQGFGDTRPVADNADEGGRARNRRVELVRI